MATKRVLLVVLLMVGAASGLYLRSATVLRAEDSTACSIPFEVAVRQGPSTGMTIDGTLDVSIDSTGALTGNLKQDKQPDIPVTGQVTGRAINLAFDLSTADHPGVFVFGVGTALDPIASDTCGTYLGGPFVGPQKGDSGDWFSDGSVRSKSADAQPTGFNG